MSNENSFGKTIIKSLLVIEQFNSSSEIGVKELSLSTGIPASTVQRIVNTLELKNYLVQNPKNNKYRLGIALYNIAKNYTENLDWIEEAKTHMQRLLDIHQETVNLAILQGQNVVYLTKLDSPHILRPSLSVGTYFPACAAAIGRCILAYQPPEILDRILSAPIEARTKNTIIDTERMRTELIKIRQSGYAIEDEEFCIGIYCIAAPIKGYKGRVTAAISTTIPKYRLDEDKVPIIVKDIMETAKNISEVLTNFEAR